MTGVGGLELAAIYQRARNDIVSQERLVHEVSRYLRVHVILDEVYHDH